MRDTGKADRRQTIVEYFSYKYNYLERLLSESNCNYCNLLLCSQLFSLTKMWNWWLCRTVWNRSKVVQSVIQLRYVK